MSPRILRCRVWVREDTSVSTAPLPISQSSGIKQDLRVTWSSETLKIYHDHVDPQNHNKLREWNLLLAQDGQVENASEEPKLLQETSLSMDEDQPERYPAHYQVPEAAIRFFERTEQIRRTELFAIGSVLYEIASSTKPFHNKADEAVQSSFANGIFPDDVWEMPTAVSILCCWCPEFAGALHAEAQREANRPFFDRLGQHVRTNPGLFSLQVLGGIASVASLVTLPVLGMVGFGAAGPVAGSVAAGWQASIGLVQAGSLFAWCQSAAMGGAAIAGIIATGASGLTVAAGATALQALQPRDNTIPAPILKEKFQKVWSKLTLHCDQPSPKI